MDTILATAELVPEIPFRIVGSGQLEHLLDKRPENVEWVHWVNYEELPRELWGAGAALGIFGTSDKALRVIPNKAYQALATGAPLITGDTPAARELLADERDALLVPPGDPAALAGAIRRLAADPELARSLSEGGRRTYEEQASEEVLGARWRGLLEPLLR
jgi:glycosyltransferase involved in cell wall biosynthesis